MSNTLSQVAKAFVLAGVSQYISAEFIEALADRIEELEANLAKAVSDDRFLNFASDHARWSQAQFGSDTERDWTGPLAHMEREIVEVKAQPTDTFEWADMLLLLLDASRRAGIPAAQLLTSAEQKLEINKSRAWGKPNADGSVEHVRTTPKEPTGGKDG